jgi:type 2 lantibiotic biosynthesis protein LanM
VLARFATARRRPSATRPPWVDDAIWIRSALCDPDDNGEEHPRRNAFEHLFTPVAAEAESRLRASVGATVGETLTSSAREGLKQLLLDDLCTLCAAPLYERFTRSGSGYDEFIRDTKSGGLERLFDEKPVLLRLIASLTRQWLDTTREFVLRLDADLHDVRRDILQMDADSKVTRVEGGLSDPHRGGRTVLSVEFDDGQRVIYKPKDLRLDVAWRAMVQRLNPLAPVQLRAPLAIARDGYGWTEFIEHTGCADQSGCREFFRRAGAWLALFHCFAASDIHQENLIAAGDHPVPVDLETILQAGVDESGSSRPEAEAYAAARELITDSVAAIGLLPAYGRSADRSLYTVGGVASEWTAGTKLTWTDINSDSMRPALVKEEARLATNLPHVAGREVGLGEHLEDFISGFQEYAEFLRAYARDGGPQSLLDGYAGLPTRKVLRPTQFYYMLLGRLKDDRTMGDGVMWSVQADFLARLADWDGDHDLTWPLHETERSALVELNVPLFMMQSDEGLQRARERLRQLDDREIAWQTAVIRQTSSFVADSSSADTGPRQLVKYAAVGESRKMSSAEADAAAEEISRYATRRDTSAAWIGLSWFPDSDVSQLAVVAHDLYNGTSGIATFLAAHAKTARRPESAELALAAIAYLRAQLRSRGASRVARLLGIGGASGLGSVIYAFTTVSQLLGDDDLLLDAHRAAGLVSDDLIASDRQLDVVGGSAGAILCLLRLYAATGEKDVLSRAVKCGDHLLAQDRVGSVGRRSWPGPGRNGQVLNGMSHGAAGFAYALTSLAVVAGREEFVDAARECVEFERCNYDAEQGDWADFRVEEPHWRSQWCHGAVGIGLARLGMTRRDAAGQGELADDIGKALAGATRGWPGHVDTLCCGSLGSVELFREAGKVLGRRDLREISSERLSAVLGHKMSTGDFRWSGGARQFNVGLFRGLAGIGYTCLREIDDSLPNVLIWE